MTSLSHHYLPYDRQQDFAMACLLDTFEVLVYYADVYIRVKSVRFRIHGQLSR